MVNKFRRGRKITDKRVCFNLVIIEGQFTKDRMKLFIVNEDLGF